MTRHQRCCRSDVGCNVRFLLCAVCAVARQNAPNNLQAIFLCATARKGKWNACAHQVICITGSTVWNARRRFAGAIYISHSLSASGCLLHSVCCVGLFGARQILRVYFRKACAHVQARASACRAQHFIGCARTQRRSVCNINVRTAKPLACMIYGVTRARTLNTYMHARTNLERINHAHCTNSCCSSYYVAQSHALSSVTALAKTTGSVRTKDICTHIIIYFTLRVLLSHTHTRQCTHDLRSPQRPHRVEGYSNGSWAPPRNKSP